MITKKNLFAAVLLTFCISAVMFFALPIRSQTSHEYDPWADVSGPIVGQPDGVINIIDIAYEARLFTTHGTPLNRTQIDRAIELQQLLEHILNKNFTDWYNGLVGYWRLDEGTGNVTADSSGNGNDGILIDDPTWVEGKYGKALNLNGTNYVSIADSESLEVQNFTLEAWIYMTQRPYQQSNSSCAIISKYGTDAETSGIGYKLAFEYPNSTDDNLVISTGRPMAGERVLVQYNSINDLTLNQLHHVVGTLDGHTVTLYIDGISRISRTYPETIEILYWKSFPLLLGVYGLNGLIDNAMIYNRTLSAEEVMLHYLIPPP